MFFHQHRQTTKSSNKSLQKQQQTTYRPAPQVIATHPATLIQKAKLSPNSLNADDVLTLQGTIGNRAANRLLASQSATQMQAKLTIGQPGDKYEQEADRVASQVVEQLHAPASGQSIQGQSVQRQDIEDEELQAKPSSSDLQRSPLSPEVQLEAMLEGEELQAKSILQRQEAIAAGEASTDLDTAINSARGSGQPLESGLQQSMGQAMGADFSGVKVHKDSQSDQLNQSIQARAFTTRQDVFFRQGEYNPGSKGGKKLIAHELTHVVQQNRSQVQNIQRLPLLNEFQEQSAKVGTRRNKIRLVDQSITAYHSTAIDNYQEKAQILEDMITKCRHYLDEKGTAEERRRGIQWLLPMAEKELMIFLELQKAEIEGNTEAGYKAMVKAQDLVSEAEMQRANVSQLHSHIGLELGELVKNIKTNNSNLIQELIRQDLEQLQTLSQDSNVPEGTRRILQEVLSNESQVNFEESAPGARLRNPRDAHDKKYQVNHALSPSEGLGTAERLGSLTHELTHVSSGESYNNTSAFMLFSPDMPVDEVIALAQNRVVNVNELELLAANNDSFSQKQKALLQFKLNYAKENKLLLYAAKFSDAARAKLNNNPDDAKGLEYQQASEKMFAVAQAVPQGNSALIEYDTVMNQMLLYMHMWNIQINNQFYTRLQVIANEAYEQRRTAREG